jgi:hypothetical protein
LISKDLTDALSPLPNGIIAQWWFLRKLKKATETKQIEIYGGIASYRFEYVLRDGNTRCNIVNKRELRYAKDKVKYLTELFYKE